MSERVFGQAKGLCNAVLDSGFIYAVATDSNSQPAQTIQDQTRNALASLDAHLNELGSNKTCLLSATVYLSDINNKAQMNEIWCDWIGDKNNWPQRACVGVALDPGYLIEVVVTAKSAKV